jgi:hypothetical protein
MTTSLSHYITAAFANPLVQLVAFWRQLPRSLFSKFGSNSNSGSPTASMPFLSIPWGVGSRTLFQHVQAFAGTARFSAQRVRAVRIHSCQTRTQAESRELDHSTARQRMLSSGGFKAEETALHLHPTRTGEVV